MALLSGIHSTISKHLRSEAGMKFKDAIRPAKNALFGKQRIYKVIEMVGDMERKAGNKVTTVFDIGAAIGEAALPIAREFPDAQIYCFEPLPDSFKRLQQRTSRYADRIKYFNYGLYNENKIVKFNVSPHRDASTILDIPNGEKTISIPVRRVDDVVRELGIQKIHFMKIDVEGAEKQLFEGGREVLKITDNVFVEINASLKGKNSHDYIDIFELLHGAGFSFVGVWDDFFFSKLI